jgi:adenylate cyclase
VVGADIQLEKLGGFLGSLQRESRGKLAIVEKNGDFVAFSETAKIIVEEGDGLRPLNIRELSDPAISEAFDRVRVLGRGQSSVTIDGVNYLLASSSLEASVGRDWLLLMLSPEEAYVGFIAANSRSGLLASGIVVVLAVLLAGFLAYQGYLAERDTRRLRRDQAKLAKQSEAFEELSALPSFADNGDQTSLRRALELMVELSGAQRVSLWRLSHRRQEMIALATYDSEGNSHTSGALLRGGDFPAFFSEMRQGKEVHIRNATADPRAAALHMTYLRPVGVSGIISHPVERKDQTVGALWLEYRGEAPEEESGSGFAQMLANLAAPLIAASEQERSEGDGRTLEVVKGSPAAVAALAELRGARLCDERAIRVERRLGPEGKSGAALFPNTTVLALKFFDDSSLAAALKDEQSPLVIRRIVSAFQEAADGVGVPYLKILTDQIIAVDGLEGDESAAAHRLMQVALSMQDVCSSLFLELGRGPQYAFGLDTGPSVGSHVGFGQSPYNIWGESVRVALSLASSAQPGSILVSEATYELLREDYLFRRRGSYYLDQVGEMETFTLRGHL